MERGGAFVDCVGWALGWVVGGVVPVGVVVDDEDEDGELFIARLMAAKAAAPAAFVGLDRVPRDCEVVVVLALDDVGALPQV